MGHHFGHGHGHGHGQPHKKHRTCDNYVPDCDVPGCDGCDLPGCDGCDGCDVCDCNLSVFRLFRLSSLLLAVSRLAPDHRRATADATGQAGTGGLPVVDRAGLAGIAAYRRWISPRTAPRCRLTPTCSAYGSQAVAQHGLRDGLRLTAARLRRCAGSVPPGSVDPVPRAAG